MADPFPFELVSPERLLLSEPALSVVVPGSEGEFEVLKNHAPFMSTIKPGVVTVTLASGPAQRFFVRGGFADVNASGLTILAEQAIPVESLNAEDIAKQIRDAEEDVADARDDISKTAAATRLAQLKDVQAVLGH
ncbi:F0F1 ATP synthase subunit epsilon [Mesorhizobium sp. BR1-1-16]|jgi:F-type H+-transporting ATPase subunit epsilon|uniref:F0F1 ATP synthase subunit epsilon n=1 Tax=Mesorhizobium sp. BR1-1-16 TaxID=2876653 RepID=UPI001CCEC2F9|nr:F0F1 ATP synthase subunit epsilon [Mesorhizobium sp. BR1-1-16]MBZ9937422.1 F0F1 ATP synthase subunit epsilon [Mesorhizobium sp. BR1-1-16]HWJ71618.1 F0F1 ATP synthase subunit epsilon [Kaistia sp.]